LPFARSFVEPMEQVEALAHDAPRGADAIITKFGRLVGGVPALHDLLKPSWQFGAVVSSEPSLLDQSTTKGRRRLLVLAGEGVFPKQACSG